MTPKLIALDMDGTLLDDAGRISPRTVDALQAVVAAGHRVVLATGRPPIMAIPVAIELAGTITHVVGANGSIISTFPTSAEAEPDVLHEIGFTIDDAAQLVTTLRHHDQEFGFALATERGFAFEHGFAELMPAAVPGAPVDDVLTVGGSTALKLFAFHGSRSVHELLEFVPKLLEENPPVGGWASDPHVSHMGADAVEIGLGAADKSAGLAWLCARLGVERSDVIAIGDEWNDLTMLEWAGRGVAMGNADALVQAAAGETIGTNNDHGVARFLESLV